MVDVCLKKFESILFFINLMDIIIKNDKRYRKSRNTYRKICCIEECILFACGEYCLKHKPIDATLKKCSICYRQKPHDMFVKDDVTYLTCLVCVSKKLHQTKRSYSKKQKLLIDLKVKLGGKCIDCGVDNLEILEFDHIDQELKRKCISRLISNVEPIGKIKEEIDKCKILCGNCHRKYTIRQMEYNIIDIIANMKQ